MLERNTSLNLIVIILVAFLGLGVVFPNLLNRGIDLFGGALPHLPDISFKLGLDLQGGSRLLYEADLSKIQEDEKDEAMQGLRDVIERRINIFGVREPIIHVEEKGENRRLVVELPGIRDVAQAIKMIGQTPYLEFREQKENKEGETVFEPTPLTGQYLEKATLAFDRTTLSPYVLLDFNKEGSDIFKDLTEKNVGKRLAIFIDDVLISAPVVQEAITGGRAQITGSFTVEEAKTLARNLNAGALPVPIHLIQQTTIGPTLGKASLGKSLKAGLFGLLGVCLIMILIYRLSGFWAGLSLLVYALVLLSIFKLVPVTLTLAGIGGAILSIGMAVDANVLIFERYKEERKKGDSFSKALNTGFSRAWPSIRDSNFTTLIVALIMFGFGTSFLKGFALTLSLGILTSLFSALFVTKTFLKIFVGTRLEKVKWLWG